MVLVHLQMVTPKMANQVVESSSTRHGFVISLCSLAIALMETDVIMLMDTQICEKRAASRYDFVKLSFKLVIKRWCSCIPSHNVVLLQCVAEYCTALLCVSLDPRQFQQLSTSSQFLLLGTLNFRSLLQVSCHAM